MSEPTPMTYAAALAILKAPRFADPDAIAARDLIAAVERVAELLAAEPHCRYCAGSGWNMRPPGGGFPIECEACAGMGVEGGWEPPYPIGDDDELSLRWRPLPPDARQEALRRARTQRQGQGGSQVPAGKAVRP